HGTLAGSTDHPQVAFSWLIDETVGATIRGSWGTSFRFANAGEYSAVLSDNNQFFNLPGEGPLPVTCSGNSPTPGSANADLVAAGIACGQGAPGVTWGGAPHPALRSFVSAATGQPSFREGG